jgi:hypothetical protein
MRQKVQIAWAVDTRQHGIIKSLGRVHRAKVSALQLGQHMVGTGWHLKTRHQFAAKHFKLALVLGVEMVVKGDHVERK